jgi:UDP-glucose 4-epimerase
LQIKPKVVLNIGTGRGTSTYQLAQIITKISASASSVEMIDINDKTYKVIADTSEAKHYLNWQAKTNLETGLRELWTWSSL